MERITSADNSTVKLVRRLLNSRQHRGQEGLFALEGFNSISALFAEGQERLGVEILLVSDSLAATEQGARLLRAADGVRRVILPDDLLGRIQDVRSSQGILAVARIPDDPLPRFDAHGRYLLADHIADPGNMGTLIRSAVAAEFSGLFLWGDCVDVFNPKCVRSTAGTLPFLPIWQTDPRRLGDFTEQGFDLISAQMGSGASVYEADFGPRNILAIGSEAHGLSPEIVALTTRTVHIPISPRCESLNAAIAGSLIMFAMQNRRRIEVQAGK